MLSPLVKRPAGDVDSVEDDATIGWCDQSYSHAEAGRFTGTVRSQQSDDFARIDMERDPIDGSLPWVLFDKTYALQQ